MPDDSLESDTPVHTDRKLAAIRASGIPSPLPEITEEDTFQANKHIGARVGPGPDCIPAKIVKKF